MSLNNALIYPANNLQNYTKKELITKNSTNIINLILPNNSTNLSSFKLIDKINPKVYLNKKGLSLKSLNLKQKIPLMKDNPLKNYSKDKKILKSSSANKNIFNNFFNKISYKKNKNNSFYLQTNKEIIPTESINNNKNDTFSKLNLDLKHLKNTKSFCSSRNISDTNSEKLIQVNKNKNNNNNNNNNQILSRQSKKLKSNNSYLIKNKSTYIPKFKKRINISLYVNPKKGNNYNLNKSKKIETKAHNKNKTHGISQTNLSDKENINFTNINDTNINESLIFCNFKQNSKKKINLPFSPTSNKENFYRQIKYKKCYIRNNKNDTNIPYNKNNKLSRQNSYYNLNLNNIKNRQNKKHNNTTREDGNSFADTDNVHKKNSSFDLINKTNTNSYYNCELCISANENNIHYKGKDNNYGVEMSHFNIVKSIQHNKSMLVKSE